MPSRLTSAWALAITAGIANAAFADCDPLIAALEKVDREQRFAQYDVTSRDAPIATRPMLVRIGTDSYVMGSRSDTRANPLLTALRARSSNGGAKCDVPVVDTARGVSAHRISFVNPIAPKTMSKVTVWISSETGLPVYHEIRGLRTGGFAWVYANAVSIPVQYMNSADGALSRHHAAAPGNR